MFEVGQAYKVKVEPSPGQAGFGRATVVERRGNHLVVQIRTSKGLEATFPKGTRIWFVSESTDAFNGLWASSIAEARPTDGKMMLVCNPPKLEPLYQRRRTPRVPLDVPVQIWLNDEFTVFDVRSKDISRSGIALESVLPLDLAEPGDEIKMIVQSSEGNMKVRARIIRVDKNWLANKTTVGLEFTDVPDDARTTLDSLLVLLGGTPRIASGDDKSVADRSGLASWMSAPSEVRGRFVGAGGQPKDAGTKQEEKITEDPDEDPDS